MSGNGDNDEASDENEHHSVDADFDIDIDAKVDDDHDSEAKSEANEEGPHQSIDRKPKPSHLSLPSASLSCLHSIPEFDDDDDGDDEKYEVHSIVFYWFNSYFLNLISHLQLSMWHPLRRLQKQRPIQRSTTQPSHLSLARSAQRRMQSPLSIMLLKLTTTLQTYSYILNLHITLTS